MGTYKPQMAASVRKVKKVLMDDWNPIGVRDDPGVADEYDSYVLPVFKILRKHGSEGTLLDYLVWVFERMGLPASRESLRPIAGKLRAINLSGDERSE